MDERNVKYAGGYWEDLDGNKNFASWVAYQFNSNSYERDHKKATEFRDKMDEKLEKGPLGFLEADMNLDTGEILN